MTVGDVLKNVGIMIGRPDIVDFFGEQMNVGYETYDDVMSLLKILNLVVSELSNTYFPLTTEQDVTFYNGQLPYADLEKRVVKVIEIYDYLGNKVDYKENAEYIELVGEFSDSIMLTISYQFAPYDYYEDSEIGYAEKDVPARIIAYGVAAEFCISQSRFEEAVMHHNRYILALQELKGPKNKKIKARSWQ